MSLIRQNSYLKFPLRIVDGQTQTSDRIAHIWEQIEQLLFTAPEERVLRPEYGAGINQLVFEPNHSALHASLTRQISADLRALLKNEADPESVSVKVIGIEEQLFVQISYTLVAFDSSVQKQYPIEFENLSAPVIEWPSETPLYQHAQTPSAELVFDKNVLGEWTGSRKAVNLPKRLPALDRNVDWEQRDFDSFRAAMLGDLATAFPQRSQWSVSDLEVVLTEVAAFGLDMLSDMTDRVVTESYLSTVRTPERLLVMAKFLGYDPIAHAPDAFFSTLPKSSLSKGQLEQHIIDFWRRNPFYMQQVKQLAPSALRQQERMVTLDDYQQKVSEHPLVSQCQTRDFWNGSRQCIGISLILIDDLRLNSNSQHYWDELIEEVKYFHLTLGMGEHHKGVSWLPDFNKNITPGMLLQRYIDAYRMIGQEVVLEEGEAVGVDIDMQISVSANYFRSEVTSHVDRILSSGTGGFFSASRLQFGEDVTISDIIQFVQGVEGVEYITINRFKRSGSWPDVSSLGRIVLREREYAVLENDPARPLYGQLQTSYIGGLKG